VTGVKAGRAAWRSALARPRLPDSTRVAGTAADIDSMVPRGELAMSSPRILFSALAACAVAALGACTAGSGGTEMAMSQYNPFTGEGLPNPAPTVTANWGQLPAGREWGTTAGIDIDPTDGNIWAYERCGQGAIAAGDAGGGLGGNVNCDSNMVDPIFKFDRHTGAVLANFGKGLFATPHGIHVDSVGNVWVTDFASNQAGTKGHQVIKFSPTGEVLMTIGMPGKPGNGPGQLNQPNDVITAGDGSIFIADGHNAQGMTTQQQIDQGNASGQTSRILKFTADGTLIKQWGKIGYAHGEFRTPHALEFDSQGRLWVADRGNHRIEIYDQNGNYLESRYEYGRTSGIFITADDMVYAIDSESTMLVDPNWRDGVRIGHLNEDALVGYIPPFDADGARIYSGTAGEGIAVDADGNVFAAEGPNSLRWAGGAFTKYGVAGGM
jgi:NHL repeat